MYVINENKATRYEWFGKLQIDTKFILYFKNIVVSLKQSHE